MDTKLKKSEKRENSLKLGLVSMGKKNKKFEDKDDEHELPTQKEPKEKKNKRNRLTPDELIEMMYNMGDMIADEPELEIPKENAHSDVSKSKKKGKDRAGDFDEKEMNKNKSKEQSEKKQKEKQPTSSGKSSKKNEGNDESISHKKKNDKLVDSLKTSQDGIENRKPPVSEPERDERFGKNLAAGEINDIGKINKKDRMKKDKELKNEKIQQTFTEQNNSKEKLRVASKELKTQEKSTDDVLPELKDLIIPEAPQSASELWRVKREKKLQKKSKKNLVQEIEQQEEEPNEDELTKKLENFSMSQAGTSKSVSDQNNRDIKVENFTISAGGKQLYRNASLTISHGRRYGFVGPNGMGKSTLLMHIATRKLSIPTHIDILLCEQDFEATDCTAIDFILKSDKTVNSLLDKERKMLDRISANDLEAVNELKEVQDELRGLNVDSAYARACEILYGLGFTEKMMKSPTKHFSGGWRMRISLARALFIKPTLLLLDEPTNHLDLNAVVWLESYLEKWDHTLLVVSHDQHFLDAICTDIIHLDGKKLYYYKGNYAKFKSMYSQQLLELQKAYEQQEKRLKILKKSGKSCKDAEKSVKATNKMKHEKGGKGKRGTDQVDDGVNPELDLIERPNEYFVKFAFSAVSQLAPPILGLKNVYFRYSDTSSWLFEDLNFGIDLSSRVAIVGPNGVGKSTLLKLLLEKIQPSSGEIIRNRRCRVGFFSQHSADQLEHSVSPVEYLSKRYNVNVTDCRATLGKFGLPGYAHLIKIESLSGGQRSRVALCDIALSKPDVIIMDEPTNNLDIESIDALAYALSKYEGGVVIVSHDARLIMEANCTLWIVEDKKIYEIDGDFNDYRDEILADIAEKAQAASNNLSKK